jgi:hypothetical protein
MVSPRFNIRIKSELHAKVERTAKEQRRTTTDMIRIILEDWAMAQQCRKPTAKPSANPLAAA